jgi:hypothetical protein
MKKQNIEPTAHEEDLYDASKEMEFLKSTKGKIMVAEAMQTWGDKDKEKAKQDYIKQLKKLL